MVGAAANVAVLIAGVLLGAGVGLIAAECLGWAGVSTLLPVAVATGLCLLPSTATMLLASAVFRQAPQLGPVVVMLGTAMRMVVAVVGVVLLAEVLARYGVPRNQFAGWVTYLYIVTLAAECAVLIAALGRTNPEPGAPS